MIIRQLKVTLILVAALMTISIGAKAVGALQPPNPALRGFVEGWEGKPQPCWYGILPEATTRADAEKIAGKLGFITCRIQFEYSESGDTIMTIGLRACDGIQLGDLLVQYRAIPADRTTIYVNSGDSLFSRVIDFDLEVRHPVTLIPVN